MAEAASRVLRTGGLFFGGVNDYVRIPNSPSLVITGDLTIIAWVNNRPPIREYNVFVSLSEVSYNFRMRWSNLSFAWRYLGKWVDIDSSLRLEANTWYFTAVTRKRQPDGNFTCTLYKNTQSQTFIDKPPTDPITYPLYIGCSIPGYWHLYGNIDEIYIYNRVLSADEIYEIYSKGTLITNGLVLCLPFYEGEGKVVHDVSGYNNHGTIYDGASWAVKKALRVLPRAR